MPRTGKDGDVLIIGAGIAGITAARELSRHGVPCLVLEARDRIGGRIFSRPDPSAELPLELGAEFIHGFAERTLALAREFRLPFYEIPDRHLIRHGRNWVDIAEFWPRLNTALIARPRQGVADESFASALARTRLRKGDRRLITSFVQGFHAADPARISQRALGDETRAANQMESNRSWRFLQGYGALVDRLWGDIPKGLQKIAFGEPVRTVEWERGRVEARTSEGRRYRGRMAILTVPPPALKKMRFFPEIHAKIPALAHLENGCVVKAVARFRECFWEEAWAGGGIFRVPDAPLPTWWSAFPFDTPRVTGWAGGPPADRLRRGGRAGVREAVCTSLAQAFTGFTPRKIRGLLKSVDFHDWSADRFSLGAYSYVTVGGAGSPEAAARPIGETLYFAGEATEGGGLGGTVESAIRSGERAACEVRRAWKAPR